MIPDLYNRKHRLGEFFVDGWKIYCRYFVYLVAFVLSCEFLALLFQFAVPKVEGWGALRIVAGLFAELITLIGTIAVMFITVQATSGLPVSWESCRRKVSDKLGSAMWVNVILFVFLGLAVLPIFLSAKLGFSSPVLGGSHRLFVVFLVILFLLPVLLLSNLLRFSIHAVVLRQMDGIPALAYSWRLVRHRWWYVLITSLLLGLPVGIIRFAGTFVLKAGGLQENVLISGSFELLGSVFSIYTTILITLFFLNIDWEGSAQKVDELKHPVDPVNLSDGKRHDRDVFRDVA